MPEPPQVVIVGGGISGLATALALRDLAAERGLSVFDVRHRLLLNETYEFPFGQRKRYLNRGGLAAKLVDDWRVIGTTSIQSGTPLTARVLGNQSASGGIGAYFSGRAEATGLPVSLSSSDRTTLDYFNTSAFTLPPAGEFGNAGRNTIPGPHRQFQYVHDEDHDPGAGKRYSTEFPHRGQ